MAPTIIQPEVATITFLSYNSTGMDTLKTAFINEICQDYDADFINIQEHMKFVKNTDNFFKSKFPDHSSYVIPAHREINQDSGRGKAGLAQLTNRSVSVRKESFMSRV